MQWLLEHADLDLPPHSSAPTVRQRLLHRGREGRLQLQRQSPALLTCMLQPEHVLYVPSHWWHATLNVGDYNFFTSYFIQESRQQQQQQQLRK